MFDSLPLNSKQIPLKSSTEIINFDATKKNVTSKCSIDILERKLKSVVREEHLDIEQIKFVQQNINLLISLVSNAELKLFLNRLDILARDYLDFTEERYIAVDISNLIQRINGRVAKVDNKSQRLVPTNIINNIPDPEFIREEKPFTVIGTRVNTLTPTVEEKTVKNTLEFLQVEELSDRETEKVINAAKSSAKNAKEQFLNQEI
jgi:hypothetical protein